MDQSTQNIAKAFLLIGLASFMGGCSDSPLYGEQRSQSSTGTSTQATCNKFEIKGANYDAPLLKGRIKNPTNSARIQLIVDKIDNTFFDGVFAGNNTYRPVRTRFYKISSQNGTQIEAPLKLSVFLKGTNTLYRDSSGNLPDYLSYEVLAGFEKQINAPTGTFKGISGLAKLDIYVEDIGSGFDTVAVVFDSSTPTTGYTHFIKPVFDADIFAFERSISGFTWGGMLVQLHPFYNERVSGTDYGALAAKLCEP